MLVQLVDAVGRTCGGKAGALGALLRAGLPVPEGFVIPFTAYRAVVHDLDLGRLTGEPGGVDAARRAIAARSFPGDLHDAVARALEVLGDVAVAVRSWAGNEDTVRTSAAGQHESVLAVQGVDQVAHAVRTCWASLYSPGAVAYRETSADSRPAEEPVMGVLVQRQVDAEVSGVMFTSGGPDDVTEIEASWGLGPSVVGGTVTPDAYRVAADGAVTRTVADKGTRLDRHGTRLVTSDVLASDRGRPTLDDATAARLARLGQCVAVVLGGAQDIEWAFVDGRTWLLQARPITAALPPPRSPSAPGGSPATLTGTPGSRGTATGTARVVRGPDDFARVVPGDILVCPWTDPGWTPLLRIAAGVVTETGGVLSHAAIVAREHRIPAVLGIPDATTTLHDAATITIDGTAGTVTTHA
ncbi:PEP/pyruvate-binding domain-containing protein [Cellulomonas sp. KRMCY2]|uniref:PEP/pyruvate-binding domain-containing protein n=1 Tax=Cellulomonas sp. KRMCY2 TaxID=1304865 RepID=UPI00045E6FB2|nr:PEP/pyruvate-binding domain-containing protein [Cellulomonas sp. KRMCY2]